MTQPTNTTDTKEKRWRTIRKAIEQLKFWSPLRKYYFETCTKGTDADWADSCINDCQNEVHRLFEELHRTELIKQLQSLRHRIYVLHREELGDSDQILSQLEQEIEDHLSALSDKGEEE